MRVTLAGSGAVKVQGIGRKSRHRVVGRPIYRVSLDGRAEIFARVSYRDTRRRLHVTSTRSRPPDGTYFALSLRWESKPTALAPTGSDVARYRSVMAASLNEELITLLRKPLLAHVATVMPDGTPQSTPVWIDTDGENVLFNTAKGRVKHRNIVRNPAIAVSFVDDENIYRMVEIRGTADVVEDGADEHIDFLSKKYLNQDKYPFRQPGEERVIVRIRPVAIAGV